MQPGTLARPRWGGSTKPVPLGRRLKPNGTGCRLTTGSCGVAYAAPAEFGSTMGFRAHPRQLISELTPSSFRPDPGEP